MRSKTAFLLIIFVFAAPGLAERGREYIQVREVTMTLEDGDAAFDVKFDLDPFARLYVLALGTKHIEPELIDLFSEFGNLTVARTEPHRAVIVSKGAAELKSGYYLYDSRLLRHEIPKLTVIYPERLSRTFYQVSATPSVFSEA